MQARGSGEGEGVKRWMETIIQLAQYFTFSKIERKREHENEK